MRCILFCGSTGYLYGGMQSGMQSSCGIVHSGKVGSVSSVRSVSFVSGTARRGVS